MAVQKYTKLKDLNPQLLEEEVEALSPPIPAFLQSLPGFDRSDTNPNAGTPMVPATRAVTTRGGVPTDTAVRGEVRYETRNALTVAQVTAIDGALDAHVATGKSREQANLERIQDDLATLKTRLPLITDADLKLTAQLTTDLGDDVF